MTRQIVVPESADAALVTQARNYARASMAGNTQRAYRAAWEDFTAYCAGQNRIALPAAPATVVMYLTFLARGQTVSTIQVKLAAISAAHQTAKLTDPTADNDVHMVMKGIRHDLGTAPDKKAPVTLTDLRAMVGTLSGDVTGARDRAVILIGWAGAFRRSELVGLDVADVQLSSRLTIRIRKSKTDQEGAGMVKVIPSLADQSVCALSALRGWLFAGEIKAGSLFRAVDQWGPHPRQPAFRSVRRLDRQSRGDRRRAGSQPLRWPKPAERFHHRGSKRRRPVA